MSFFLQNLKKRGHLDKIQMTICNVGSRKLVDKDDYGSQEWQIFAPQLSIYGFDADADVCDGANTELETRQINWTEKHIPLVLSNSVGESTLYVTKNPMCSSLYPPNESYLARFYQLAEVASLDFMVEIETTTLDEFCQSEKIDEIDFLQIDVQGAELNVLEGASHILEKSVLALQIEVWFSDIYINQPLFAEVDQYIRKQGFTFFNLRGGFRHHISSPIVSQSFYGQFLWGDAFYFRDLIRDDRNPNMNNPEKILKLACIADLLDFPDYALELLEYLTLKYGNNPDYNMANSIIDSLAQIPELVEHGLSSLPIVAKLRDYIILPYN
ncbi:MAG: hypothetical protein RLZZ338_1959 [Cyanobacteriota bacterium]|jgi:FkbM family methyltransferase